MNRVVADTVSSRRAGRRALRAVGRVRLFGLAALAGVAACSVPTDAELFPDPTPAFKLVGSELPLPAGSLQPLDPIVRLVFSDFPAPAGVKYPVLRLGTRTQTVEFLTQIDLVDRRISIRPRRQLLPENDYFVEATSALRSLAGAPLAPAVQLRFRTGAVLSPLAPDEPSVTTADVLGRGGALQARCAIGGCHRSEAGAPAAAGLDLGAAPDRVRAQLIGVRAGGPQPGSDAPASTLRLVEPGLPEQSYLLRKLLMHRGFTGADGQPMPPPPLAPLEDAALRTIERWIRAGAP